MFFGFCVFVYLFMLYISDLIYFYINIVVAI